MMKLSVSDTQFSCIPLIANKGLFLSYALTIKISIMVFQINQIERTYLVYCLNLMWQTAHSTETKNKPPAVDIT